MGILRVNQVSGDETQLSTLGIGTTTPVTGSVFFDGNGDYLTLASSGDFAYGTGDFTWEGWFYVQDISSGRYIIDHGSNGGTIEVFSTSSSAPGRVTYYNSTTFTSSVLYTTGFGIVSLNTWNHFAAVRRSGTTSLYLNGNLTASASDSHNYGAQVLNIGRYGGGGNEFYGYISNLRILKGTALYTSNFTPPTLILEPIQDTVLLCCNNPDSAGAVSLAGIGTSKTITVNGNAVASTFNPGLVRNFTSGTQFTGVTKFDTQGYFVPPSGTTEKRNGGRGVFTISSGTPANSNAINYLQISSSGSSQDFGDLTSVSGSAGSVSSSTRMIIALGNNSPVTASPGNVNTLDYLTIATTSNALDFGDLTTRRGEIPGVSNSTRGVFIGGVNELVSPYSGPTIGYTNTMDYVSIASLGNAIDFGDAHSDAVSHASAVGNTTRGVYTVSWNSSTTVNNINYITFSTTGNGQDFGDLITPQNRQQKGSVSNSTRGLFAGGISPVTINTIEYITITSLGNAQDFGDLTYFRYNIAGTSNSIRGIFAGGYDAPPGTLGKTNVIDYVILASTGNASDFGDLIERCRNGTGASDSHGGIS